VQVQRPDGTMEMQPGPYVEPVQPPSRLLPVVGQITRNKNEIDESDLAQVGDVNTALAEFYASSVEQIAGKSGESERTLREWFDRQLITEQAFADK